MLQCYCSDELKQLVIYCDLFSAADASLFKRVLWNELHVLQPLLPAKTSFSYKLQHTSYHNRQL